jgi:Domain of unknown function (DUF4352)
MSDQTPQQPGWGPPPEPPAKPSRQPRQFTTTKIAIGVAAGIALFLIGAIVLLAVLLGSGSSGDKKATAAPATTAFTAPASTPAESTPVDETPTTQAPEVASVGDSFSATADDGSGADITVAKVSTARYDPGTIEPNDSSFWEHPQHGLYLIVRVTAKGTGSTGFDFNPGSFSVVAPDGQTYDEQTYSDTWGQSFPDSSLHNGETRRGVLVFDVSKRAAHGQIAYDPNYSGDPIATWKY